MIRNKTLIKGFALAALLPIFFACSSEDDSPVQGGEPQEVQVRRVMAAPLRRPQL